MITKPLDKSVFRKVTIILLISFVVSTYFFTNGYEINEPIIILRNISIPFVAILLVYMYNFFRYKQNMDILIEMVSDNEYRVNGKYYSINSFVDYIRVVKYGNRVGSVLYGIYLIIGGHKIFIVRDLYAEEYSEAIESISHFLKMKIAVFD